MPLRKEWILALLIVAVALPLSACGESSSSAAEEKGPATLEKIKGTELVRVTLTPQAAKRIGVETAEVREASRGKVIPYAAVLYGTKGDTFTYVNPKGLTYVRRDIKVDRIEGNRAFLVDGPGSGTAVVTVGAAELLGAETEFDSDSH